MPKPKRPPGAAAIAICNILLGLPCLCCSGAGTVQQAMEMANPAPPAPPGQEQKAPAGQPADPFDDFMRQAEEQGRFMAKEVPHQPKVTLVLDALSLLASIALLVSGVGLLMMRPWGRTLCLIGALALATFSLVEVVYDVIFVIPATRKFDEQQEQKRIAQKQPAPPLSQSAGAMFGVAIGALLGVGYPILAMIVMMNPAVRAAYAGTPPDEHDRYRGEDDWDEPPRRDRDDEYPRRPDDEYNR